MVVVEPQMDLLRRIDSWARLAPERLAHVTPDGKLTYAELVAGADAVAAFVQSSVPDDSSPIVVLGHKEPAMLLGFLGSVKAGHPYIPLDASLPGRRLEQVVKTAGVRLILSSAEIAQAAASTAIPAVRELRGSDVYYVMFTSGSTGEPKGVSITLGCLTNFLGWMLREHKFAAGREVFLNQAPFSFDLSVMDLYLSLATGGTLLSLTNDAIGNPRQLYETLGASGATTWVSTPSFAQLCLGERGFGAGMLPDLRRFLFCGETLPAAVAGQLLDRFPESEVWNTYGPTEATVATTSMRIDREIVARYASLPVGYPKPDSQIVVMDSNDCVLPPGQRGEIVIAGPNVSPGYFLRPDLTERSFFQFQGLQAYRTGDWGHFDQSGLLFFEGRMDSQIKLHGYRIELGDVEANLRALAAVRDAVVVPLYKHGQVDSLAAFVIPHDEGVARDFAAALQLRRALGERVPAYMVPRVVQIVSRFPMTPNGKVDRHALAETLT